MIKKITFLFTYEGVKTAHIIYDEEGGWEIQIDNVYEHFEPEAYRIAIEIAKLLKLIQVKVDYDAKLQELRKRD